MKSYTVARKSGARVASLEAENKRLRRALERIRDLPPGAWDPTMRDIAREALGGGQ